MAWTDLSVCPHWCFIHVPNHSIKKDGIDAYLAIFFFFHFLAEFFTILTWKRSHLVGLDAPVVFQPCNLPFSTQDRPSWPIYVFKRLFSYNFGPFLFIGGSQWTGWTDWTDYEPLQHIYNWLKQLENACSYCSRKTIGQSHEGLPMVLLKVHIILS